jgi:hypothetical protein
MKMINKYLTGKRDTGKVNLEILLGIVFTIISWAFNVYQAVAICHEVASKCTFIITIRQLSIPWVNRRSIWQTSKAVL